MIIVTCIPFVCAATIIRNKNNYLVESNDVSKKVLDQKQVNSTIKSDYVTNNRMISNINTM